MIGNSLVKFSNRLDDETDAAIWRVSSAIVVRFACAWCSDFIGQPGCSLWKRKAFEEKRGAWIWCGNWLA
jgi:hypothetical protein